MGIVVVGDQNFEIYKEVEDFELVIIKIHHMPGYIQVMLWADDRGQGLKSDHDTTAGITACAGYTL